MTRRFLSVVLVLLSSIWLVSVSLHAQTAAQRALINEPEVRQINAMTRNLQQQQNDPEARGSSLYMAGMSLVDLRIAQRLLDQLEARLNTEARACSFCAGKQDELSELIRERVALQNTAAQIMGPGSTSVQQVTGLVPASSRWNDIGVGFEDGASAIRAYCTPLKNQDDACKGDDAPMRLAGGHENAWASCFRAHDWVEKSSERKAYESCLAEKDPIAKLCAHARMVSPQAPACPQFTVNYGDVDQLHYYHDRFSTDPERLPANATIVTKQPARFTLLEPLTAPAMTTYPGFTTKVRARLETPLEGQYVPGLNRTTTNVSALDSKATAGLGGRVILIPAGTEFQVDVIFNTGANGKKGDDGRLSLQIVNLRGGPTMLVTQAVMRTIPWPEPGTVVMPANSGITLATQCGCPYQLSVAEFRKRAAEYTAAKAATPAKKYGVIVVGTRIPTVLLDTIDSAGVVAGQRFHAQLSADSELLPAFKRDDAITLPKGTDVYLKVTDVDGKPYTGVKAPRLNIDYMILNGQKIVVNTVGENLTGPIRLTPAPTGRRAGPPPTPVEAAGARKLFTVSEQADVNIEGMALPSATAPSSGAQPAAAATTPAANPASSPARQTAPASAGKGAAAAPTPPPEPTPRDVPTPATGARNIADFGPSWFGRNVMATGTIARVEASGPWELLYFTESTDFVACFVAAVFRTPTSPVMRVGGTDFAGLVGKTAQLGGPVAQTICGGKPGMRVLTPAQIQFGSR